MRIRWRGFELPGRVDCDPAVSTDTYARFIVEPFEQGFGTTIGNSLRRVLLSSLEGAAITSIKIEGVDHEFSCMDGVVEDVTAILLNIKGIIVSYDGDEPKTMTLKREKAGEIRASEIETDPAVKVINPDHLIATSSVDTPFNVEFTVQRGRGYATAKENLSPEQEIGVIPLDSVFSPVLRVRYRTEDMRVGQRTNFDRLILDVWTNGSVLPADALAEAGLILRKHLNPFVMHNELGDDTVSAVRSPAEEVEASLEAPANVVLDSPVSVLNLSVRATNCLEAVRVTTIRQLVGLTEAELLRFRSFGKTSLMEVRRKLQDLGLELGSLPSDEADADAAGYSMNAPAPMEHNDNVTPSFGPVPPSTFSDPVPPVDQGMPSTDPSAGPMAAFTMDDEGRVSGSGNTG